MKTYRRTFIGLIEKDKKRKNADRRSYKTNDQIPSVLLQSLIFGKKMLMRMRREILLNENFK